MYYSIKELKMKELTEQELLLVAGGQSSNPDDDRDHNVDWSINVTGDNNGNVTVTGSISGSF